jgi:hypothetical protein
MTALLALSAALTFGASDFAGGLAARRAPALAVSWFAQAAGLLVLAPGLLLLPGVVSSSGADAGAVGGVAGAFGLVLYLRGLALGPMGLAAPLAGVTGAVLPVAIGFSTGERPSTLATVGIALGLAAVVLIGGRDLAAGARRGSSSRGPLLALLGGFGFGVFFVALDASPRRLRPVVPRRGAGRLAGPARRRPRRASGTGCRATGASSPSRSRPGRWTWSPTCCSWRRRAPGCSPWRRSSPRCTRWSSPGWPTACCASGSTGVQWGAVVACLGAVGLIAMS